MKARRPVPTLARALAARFAMAWIVLLPVTLAAWWAASAQDPPKVPHAATAACSHCHQDPHQGAGGAECSACHGTASFTPSTLTAADHDRFSFRLEGRHAETPCARCHVGARLEGLPDTCAGCHVDRHRGKLGGQCEECHTVQGFRPVPGFDHLARTGFALDGSHAVPCASCHEGDPARAMRSSAEVGCATCHAPGHGDLGPDCASCHPPAGGEAFAAAVPARVFDHRVTGFPLERRHAVLPCGECHPVGSGSGPAATLPLPVARCHTCHLDPHAAQMGIRCDDCHRADRWSLARFDHDLARWPLRGRHFVTPCRECHTNQRWIGLNTECWSCHAADVAGASKSVEAHRFGRGTCEDCHSTWSWR